MKYLYIIYISICLFILTACDNKQKNVLPQEEIASFELYKNDVIITPPMQMVDVGDYIVFSTPEMTSPLQFFDKNTFNQIPWGRKDQGPDGYSFVRWSEWNDNGDKKVRLFDGNLRKCNEYVFITEDSILLNPVQSWKIISENYINNFHTMPNGQAIGFIGTNNQDMFALMDENMQIKKTFGRNPINKMQRNHRMYGWFTSYGDRLYFASQPASYVVCFEIKQNDEITMKWERMLTEPIFDEKNDNFSEKTFRGFYDIESDENYLYLLYSGKSLALNEKTTPQNILIMTHDGDIIKNLKFPDNEILRIALSDDGIIYAYDHIWESLLKYDITQYAHP